MWSRGVLAALTAGVLVAPSAHAQTKAAVPAASDPAWTACIGPVQEQRISGCSDIIGRATETGRRRAIAYSNRGYALFTNGDQDAAMRDYDSAILIEPKLANAYNNRGLFYRAKGEHERAVAEFSHAIDLEPKNAVLLANRASTYNLRRDGDRAIRDCDAALALSPKYALAFAYRGVAHNIRNDSDAALQDFEQALAIDPKMGLAYNGRAVAYNAKGDFPLALESFDQAIAINPKAYATFVDRGFAYLARGDWVRARADFDDALKINPKYVFALNGRGFVAKASGNLSTAMADFDEAIRLDARYANAYSNRGDTYLKMGDNSRAMSDLDTAIRLDPKIAAAHVSRGILFERMGDAANARNEFEVAVAIPVRASSVTARAAHETARARLAGIMPTLTPASVAKAEPVLPEPKIQPTLPKSALQGERGPRVALVIGNAAYREVSPLPNPANDARLIAQALRDLGFKVIEGRDLDGNAMRAKIAEFGKAMQGAGVTMLFYAGHGMQVAGRNYLIPVDAKLERPSSLSTETIDVGSILADMETEKRINLVFLDACRDNPMAAKIARSLGASRSTAAAQGLAQQSAGIGTLIAFATSPETVALDGEGADSPFTLAIVKHIRTPGLEIRSMLTRVRADVIEATREQQVPWDHSSLTGDFFFRPAVN